LRQLSRIPGLTAMPEGYAGADACVSCARGANEARPTGGRASFHAGD